MHEELVADVPAEELVLGGGDAQQTTEAPHVTFSSPKGEEQGLAPE